MTTYEFALDLWKDDMKNILGDFELKIYQDVWNNPIFKINDIEIKITMMQFQDLFVSTPRSLPRYYDFGKILANTYIKNKIEQNSIEQSEAGIGCA